MEIEVGGQIQGISLGSFLQIVHMDKTSCTLKIYSNDEVGYLYLKDGGLVAAEAGEGDGVEAAYEILSWNKTVIIIDNAPIPDQNINMPLMSILMEGLRRKDEKNAEMEAGGETRTELDVQFDPETYVSKDDQIASQFVVEEKSAQADEVEFDIAPPESTQTDPIKEDVPVPGVETPVVTPAKAELPAAEKVEEDEAYEQVSFEGEEESLPKKSAKASIIKLLVFAVVLTLITFGSLKIYKVYSAKQNYNRVLAQVNSQKKLKMKKKLLSAYVNTEVDDSRYVPDVISKMNDIDMLIDIEQKVALLTIDEQYSDQVKKLYKNFLADKKSSFFKGFVQNKMQEIPLVIEQFEFKKLGAVTSLDRNVRMKTYKEFLRRFPKTKHAQAVENMIAAVGDEFYSELKIEISKCNVAGNWDQCILIVDQFINDFKNDNRVADLMIIRKEMQDRADFTDLKFRATAMNYDDSKKMYIYYLQKNLDSSVKKEIRAEISMLNRKIDFQSKWDEVYAYCTNSDVALHHKKKELKDFMERDYSGLFRDKAERLMKELKEEEKIGRAKMLQRRKQRAEKDRLAKVQAEKDRIAQEKEQARLAKIKKKQKEERLIKESERLSALLGQSGGRFRVNKDRTVTDTRTGLIWCLIDSKIDIDECMTYKQATEYVKTINTGGYKDWRLPDTSELAIIYNSKPYFPSSGAKWYWTSELRSDAWTHNDQAAVFYPARKNEFKKVFFNHSDCGSVHVVRP